MSAETAQTFGEYLTKLRKARNIPKKTFAAGLGVPFSTVNRWERHESAPTQSNMRALIAALGLSPAEKSKLTELWMEMPGRGRRAPIVTPVTNWPNDADKVVVPAEDVRALEMLLVRAVVPEKHTLADATAVLLVLVGVAPLLGTFPATVTTARAWLDAAVLLRMREAKVTGPALVIALSFVVMERPE